MIVVYHSNNKIVAIFSTENQKIDFQEKDAIALVLYKLAVRFPDKKIAWCNQLLKEQFNVLEIEKLMHHKKMMLSYCPSLDNFFDSKIGYVDESPFIKVNKSVTFPTWQMSSLVGIMHTEVLVKLGNAIPFDEDFDYYLSSLAKVVMPLGLLCYSEPKLLKQQPEIELPKATIFTLFRFVKQHYKTRWVFLLLLNLFLYERKFSVLPFLFSFFYKNRSKATINLDNIDVQSSKKVIDKPTVDVIIPTIGRKEYLYDVLKDFSAQTLLPNKIIIVEQNPVEGSVSELDYLTTETWPFVIQHIFIHQAGACNARNLALEKTESEWIFLADDDNRFEETLLSDVFDKIQQYGNPVVTLAYPQKNEVKLYHKVIQWPTFGGGNSFVRRDFLGNVKFNMALEFGYGEDVDFGMQLRNQGCDILYLPEPEILHLKAPIGGFRTKPILQWQNETIQPKPSPTIMLCQILHNTQEQISGYKTILFFKYYQHQKIKNPIRYCTNFQRQWNKSVFWANELKKTK